MKKKSLLIIFIVLLLSLTACKSKDQHLNRTEFLMDTIMTIDIYDGEKEALDKAFDALFQIEKDLSKTIKSSDVYRINENPGDFQEVKESTYFIIEEALDYAEKTEGIFEPTIGKLVDLWDVKNNESRTEIPGEDEIEERLSHVNYKNVELGDLKVKIGQGQKLDLGGIAKGHGADKVKEILVKEGVNSAIIDLGGNIYVLGGKGPKDPWKIGLQDPFNKTGEYMGILSLRDKSVVSSGDYQRYFELDGRRYHHIIDPRTGYPSNSGLKEVTVISDRSIDGDVLSTSCFILGKDKGMDLIESIPGVDAVFVTEDREVYLTEGIRDNFSLKNKDYKIK